MRSIVAIGTMALCALLAPALHAQTLNFTNELSHATGPTADRGLLQDQPQTPHFASGSAIWAVFYVGPSGFADVNAFTGAPQGGGAVRKTVEMANRSGGWDIVSSGLIDVDTTLGTHKSIVFPIIPDKPDNSQPFNQWLNMVAAHKGNGPILMRVKIESGNDPTYFTQNGFYLDVTDGLGRYGEWIAQRGAASNAASADFEQQHRQPRNAFVKNYRSLRSDPKFVADVRKWWSDKVPGSPLLSTRVCSDDVIVMRNGYGVVTEKQSCALVTYRSGNQCFAMMRRFSYRRVGRDTFENDVVDSTYADMRMNADAGEFFAGAHPYEIDCNAAR